MRRGPDQLLALDTVKYDSGAVVSRLLRLVAVASILAFGLTARTATAAYAQTPHPPPYPSPDAAYVPPLDGGDPPVVDPAPTEPPPAEPAPSDPPAETPSVDPLPTDAPAPTDAPPSDPAPSDPPPVVGSPPPDPVGLDPDSQPTDPPVTVLPPAAEATPPTDPPVPDPAAVPVPDPSPVVDAQADSEPPAAEPIPAAPVAPAARVGAASRPARNPVPVATPPRPAVAVATVSVAVDPVVPAAPSDAPRQVAPGGLPHIGLTLPTGLEPVAAGLAAGLAVSNRTPATVAVAIEFGRAGGGWAGAIVFNLWLGRQMRMRRMSQRQLAALSGVDHSTISRLLLHDRRPSLATATKLAKALRQVEGESDTADYFERVPEETLFPARRVEMALRADELLDDDEVMHVMSIYLDARRRRQAGARGGPVQVRQSTRAP